MKVNDNYEPRRGIAWKALALALAGVLTCGGTAYAIGSGFFASAFGDKGREDVPATVVDSGFIAPAMQFADVDEEEASRILAGSVQHVGLSCEAEGYTLIVDDLVMDDQGVGVATFTLTAPGGVGSFIGTYDERYPDYGYLKYEGEPTGTQLRGVFVHGAGDEMFDHYEVVDLTQTTSDELHGVIYFGAMDTSAGGIVFGLSGVSGQDVPFDEQTDALDRWEVQTDAFVPSTPVASAELADDQGHTAHVSPIGITYDAPFGEFADEAWVPDDTAIQLADGSTYVIEGTDVHNTYCSYYTLDGAMVLVFNRLVDPAQVTCVTVSGPDGSTLELLPA